MSSKSTKQTTQDAASSKITFNNSFTKLTGAKYPIIAGPMFLVSDETLVAAASNSGIVGAFPSLNWRNTEQFEKALETTKSKIDGRPFGVNLIVNKSNLRLGKDLDACVNAKVPIYITSLGSPKLVIEKAKTYGAKVFCDVTTLDYALKVQEMGADAVVAVCSGAGGHAGPISPLVLVPYLKKHLKIPVILAGGVSTGAQLAAALALGADAVQMGTRFIATKECSVDEKYKQAIINANPEDIVLTKKLTGTPAAVIKTPFIEKLGNDLNALEEFLLANKATKKWFKLAVNLRGALLLKNAAAKVTWKEVWSAGQGVGLIDSVESIEKIVEDIMHEAQTTIKNMNQYL